MTSFNLFLSVLLLAANGFFVAAEFALIASRKTKLESIAEEEGHARAAMALGAMKTLSLQLAGAQLGITMASLALGFLAEPTIAELLVDGVHSVWHDAPDGPLHTVAFIISLTLVVFLHMTLGEMVPKNLAIASPERSLLILVPVLRLYTAVFGRIARVLNGIANGIVRLMGIEPQDELAVSYTTDELASIVAEGRAEGLIEDFEGELVDAVLRFAERPVSDILVDRERMVALPVTATVEQIEEKVVQEGKSRIVLFGRDLDDVQGFVHAKDLLKVAAADRGKAPDFDGLRYVLRMSPQRSLRDALLSMRRTRIHVAIITDADQRTLGLVTLEDMLEELVGEIRDEHDRPRRTK